MRSLHAFWDWFQDYAEAYYYLQDFSVAEQAFYNHELTSRLQDYHENLCFGITFSKDGADAQLIISTNGRVDGVFFVNNLVNIAPDIPKWTIVAFIQPQLDLEAIRTGTDEPYYFKDFPIKPSDLRWAPMDFDSRNCRCDLLFHLITFPKLVAPADVDQLLDYIYIIILDLLGEEVVRQTIRFGYYEDALLHNMDWYRLDALPDFLETWGL